MSLRTTYMGALGSSYSSARAAGRLMICDVGGTPVSALVTQMTNSAASGNTNFTYRASVTFQPADLRLQGPLWTAFKTGVMEGLASQDVLINEYTMSLDTTDSVNTYLIINFTF